MRMIGQLSEEKAAQQFGDVLYVRGIQNEVEPESDNTWSIWIHDEEELEATTSLLEKFKTNPDDAEFQVDTSKVQKQKAAEVKEEEAYRKRVHDGRQVANRFGGYQPGRFTLFLMGVSIIIALISQFGGNNDVLQPLFVTEYTITGNMMRWFPGLPEIRHGQIWRVFTPMFIHFGPMHIIFNMMWLFQLGSLIEKRQGILFFALLVLSISGGSNLPQYMISGPSFGGMSGVVFGLFGYIWMKTKFDPHSGFFIDQTTVFMMIGWFFLCLTGMVGNVANTVHGVGLVVGMIWGFLNSKYRRQ